MTGLACPSCAAPLPGGPRCPACGLRLVGADAQRLWHVDQELLALDGRRAALLGERVRLLAALTGDPVAGSLGAGTPAASGTADAPAPVAASAASAPDAGLSWPALPPGPRVGPPEVSPLRVQNALLGLGALLLAVAAVVFGAVTYDRLGAGGRAAVLLLVTALALAAVPVLLRRGLVASAETATGVAVGLAVVDAFGLRALGLGDGLEPESWTALASVVLAGGAVGWARAFPALAVPRVAAVVLAQLPLPCVLVRLDAGAGESGLALAAQAAVDLGLVLLVRGRLPRSTWVTACVAGVAATAAGLAASLAAASDSEPAGALGLLVWGGLSAAAGLAVRDAAARTLLTALPVPLAALAAYSVVRDDLTTTQEPLVAAAVGLLAAQVAALLPRAWRQGPVGGALVVCAVGVGAQLQPVAEALTGPLLWLTDPWSLPAGSSARAALSPGDAWSGSVVTLVVLLAAAGAAVTAAACLHRVEAALAPAGALVVTSAVLLPLGLATGYATALGLLLLVAAALLGAARGLARRSGPVGAALAATGAAVLLLAVAWSTAAETATLVVLPLAALLAAGVAAAPGRTALAEVAAAASGLLLGASVAAAGASRGLAAEQVGGLLLVVPAVLLAASLAVRRTALEVAAGALGAVAVALAVADPGWLAWVLALHGALALAVALRPDRRVLAGIGALLLAASSWVRLADAGVTAPEPYTVPLGVVALALGHLRRRAEPSTSSTAAYLPGLSLCLVPSLLAALSGDELARPVLLLLVAAVVTVSGVAGRLRAPLLLGGGVLAVDALHLLAPYAAALPRWVPLAALGLGLVVLGVTYEQRRRDLVRLRDRLSAWG
jgi:hypothetical protein